MGSWKRKESGGDQITGSRRVEIEEKIQTQNN